MGTRLHIDPAAEREANEIAFQFQNSTDVVGDMSRAYGQDLSGVRIHTGEDAAQRVESTGMDAFSTGRDVFFARGAFNQNDPASRGLLAHELAHSLQQGGAEGVQQSAPEGAAQGGIIDWFRSKFGKKKQPEPEMDISEPTLLEGPMTAQMTNDSGDTAVRTFMNARSYGINQMLQGATREQLQSPALRQLVLDDYNTNMNARLKEINALPKDQMDSQAFRRGAGELSSLNIILGSMLPEDFSSQVMDAHKQGGTEGALDFFSQSVSGNQDLMSFLAATNSSFEGIHNYENPEDRSAMMMNNLLLRGVNSDIGSRIGMEQRAKVAALKAQGITDQRSITDAENSVDKSDLIRAMKMQKELNKGTTASGARTRNLLADLFRRR